MAPLRFLLILLLSTPSVLSTKCHAYSGKEDLGKVNCKKKSVLSVFRKDRWCFTTTDNGTFIAGCDRTKRCEKMVR
ncbi:hypothetical protein L596_009907 [Steinernema carpocapsae]|uniref:BPTI/Kunitz inhibitor domain-containing protein n=1 Tax=Steinernema carpocapsae TaxID=34508 RepID=A0A4U5PH75_STECR|nr:hypothetical protein L596_009907 [Steinernema carpocapsae]